MRRALPVALAVVVGLVVCSAPLAAQDSVRLDRVEVTGNQRVESEAIQVRLTSKPGTTFNEATVDADVRALYQMGFFDEVEADLSNVNGQWVLTYHVRERPFVQQVKIEGEKKIGKEELEGVLRVRPNTIFEPQKARRGIEEAKKLYEKKGYLDAKITYEMEPVGENQVVLTFKVDEGERVRVHDIDFEGNEAFSDSDLRGVMSTKESWFLSFITGAGNLDREALKTDVERLTAYYYDHGYIDVKIDEPIIGRDPKGLTVTIKIDEGPVFNFGAIKVAGDVPPDLEFLPADLRAQEGETFRPSLIREDINKITEIYGDRGYAFVNVTPETNVDQAARRVGIVYRVSQGPEVYIDRIEISGNTKTRDKVIRRELELQEQEKFSGTALRRSQERLRRLGFFQDVNITTRKAESEDRLDLLVDVKEGSTGAFSAGAGISSGDSFLFNVRLSEINLFGRGQRIVLNADLGTIRRNITLSFTEPYFLDTNLSLGIDAFNWQLQFEDFTRGGTGGGIRTLYPLQALGVRNVLGVSLLDTSVGLEYRIENSDISDVSRTAPAVIQAAAGKTLTSSIIPRLFRDTRNHPFDPTAGSLQDFTFEYAGLGGSSDFINLQSRARWYIPFFRWAPLGTFVAATGWTFGYGLGLGTDKELPLFERYFPGGINSVRGYEVRSLGPLGPVFSQQGVNCGQNPDQCSLRVNVDPIGGSQQLIFNNEIIFPIVESLGLKGVVFFDAGQAFLASTGIRFDQLRTSVGGGIRWLSPIGPLRIEIGYALNPQPGDKTQLVQFSFGGPP